MFRVFLAAGVAALAITSPALAGPGGHGGGQQHAPHGGGGGGQSHGGGGPHGGGAPHGAPMVMGGGHGHGGGSAFAGFRGGGGPHFAAPRMRSQAMRGYARPQYRGGYSRQQYRGGFSHQSRMVQRQQSRSFARQQFRSGPGRLRMAQRQQVHGFGRQHGRGFAQYQGRGFNRRQMRMAQRPQPRSGRMNSPRQMLAGRQLDRQQFARSAMPGNRMASQQFGGRQFGGRGAMIGGSQFANNRFGARDFGNRANVNPAPYSALTYGNNVQVIPFEQANRFIGAPVAQIAGIAALAPLPPTLQYLYPDTTGYYYRYGDGYLYQVDRGTDLIAALIPLLAGGFLPGQYLPAAYMSDYVPSYYGFNAFYSDYGGLCNRYYGGVIYQVDCGDGYVERVIPMYAGGYGVGELLPTAYSYYNVPLQYRGLYYDTPDAAYWYSPGAIYQYDPHSDVITSVAALMGPGLAVGQPLPVGYGAYNVPYAYRATYYDGPGAWYRYSNGYIYQVDPVTQLVTAVVASLLT